jgi:para-aminobenzoate synthetase/4-amino-4-deoxychorismate lyase
VFQSVDVGLALDRIEQGVKSGLHAAGFFSYEAASGLDSAVKTQTPDEFPLLWFGLFKKREEISVGAMGGEGSYELSDWNPSILRADYDASIDRIRDYIVAGDTYQVNYSFRLRADFIGDARAFYRDLCRVQRTDYAAYLDLGRFQILSASPELFFLLQDGVLTARPMKGTARRGRWGAEDDVCAEKLRNSEKERAENVMIVDLLRNDLGRVSDAGSVCVPTLWDVERYETVSQMTSTVTSRLREEVGFRELITALFPCGSVTGAPKVRTMEIIAEVEDSPRGVYTGSIGYLSPGGEMAFNVAIRTVCIDRESGMAEFGVGGGVTYGSSCDGEYEECLTKARMLSDRRPVFDLFETLRYDSDGEFFLLDRHIERLASSAQYFGFTFDWTSALDVLNDAVDKIKKDPYRVRLVLTRTGQMTVEVAPLEKSVEGRVFRARISNDPIDSHDSLLFHKTTHREPYTSRLCSDCDEVILVNERGEVTECAIGNIVAEFDGKCVTPPVSCGLLGGTFRAELLDRGELEEQVLAVEDLKCADALYMINSVREWVRLKLVN